MLGSCLFYSPAVLPPPHMDVMTFNLLVFVILVGGIMLIAMLSIVLYSMTRLYNEVLNRLRIAETHVAVIQNDMHKLMLEVRKMDSSIQKLLKYYPIILDQEQRAELEYFKRRQMPPQEIDPLE